MADVIVGISVECRRKTAVSGDSVAMSACDGVSNKDILRMKWVYNSY